MIKFHEMPANEAAVDQMVKEMTAYGYEREEAQKLADAACAIVLAMMRGMDDKVKEAVSDETDRTIVQQLILHQLIGIAHRGLEVNAVQHFIEMLRRNHD